jgi:hypothetical protein
MSEPSEAKTVKRPPSATATAVRGRRADAAGVTLQVPRPHKDRAVDSKVDTKLRVLSVEYGGLWCDVYEQLQAAQDAQQRQQAELERLRDERDELRRQFDEVNGRFRGALCSLTETESSHLETRQVLEQLRAEKEALQSRVVAYESHQQWLERQGQRLQDAQQRLAADNAALAQRAQAAERDADALRAQLVARDGAAQRHEAELERVQQLLSASEAAQDTLRRALATKTGRCQRQLREQRALSDQVAALTAQLGASRPLRAAPSSSSARRASSTPRGAHQSPQTPPPPPPPQTAAGDSCAAQRRPPATPDGVDALALALSPPPAERPADAADAADAAADGGGDADCGGFRRLLARVELLHVDERLRGNPWHPQALLSPARWPGATRIAARKARHPRHTVGDGDGDGDTGDPPLLETRGP